MTDYFSTTPAKGTPGQPLTICYDFDSSGVLGSIEVKLDYGPSTVPDSSATLSPANPCKTVTVPAAATSLLLVDNSGTSEDHPVLVS